MTSKKRRRSSSAVPPSAQPAIASRFGGSMRLVVAAIALASIAYANTLRNGFALDDIRMIVENPLIRDIANVRTIFETNYWSRGSSGLVGDPTLYRPLTVFTYAVDHQLWNNAIAYHAVNLVLHAAVTAVLFLIAIEVLGSSVAAFVAASIFAVHPIHTEAVAGVVGRAELLAALFFLLAFRVLRRRTVAGDATGALLYLLGLFSKEIAVTLPAVVAVDDWLHRHEPRAAGRSSIAGRAGRYGALALALGIYLAFRQQAVSGNAQMWPGFVGVSAGDRILTACRVLMEYIGLFIFPRTLLADYWKTDVPIATSLADPMVLLSIALGVGLVALAVRSVRRDPPLCFSIAWFCITIAPVSNILFPIGVAKAERLLYLPSVGLCLLVGWAYARAEASVRSPVLPRVALVGILAALTARTIVRNADWRDNFTLAMATLEKSPHSPLMNDIAAAELVKRGDSKRAVELLREAVKQAPDMPLIRGHLGAAYYSQGQIDAAIAEYKEAIRRNGADAEAHNNLGVVYLNQRRLEEALVEFTAAVRINPSSTDALMNTGVVHLDRGELNDATAAFTAAVQSDASSPRARNALGVAYFRAGQLDRAAEQYREALRLDPGYSAARENLGRVDQARSGSAR